MEKNDMARCTYPWCWNATTILLSTFARVPQESRISWNWLHVILFFLFARTRDVSGDITHINKYVEYLSNCSPKLHMLKWEKTLSQLLFWQDHALGMSGIGKNDSTTMEAFSLKPLPCYQDMRHSLAHACADHFDLWSCADHFELWWNGTSIIGHPKFYVGAKPDYGCSKNRRRKVAAPPWWM